MNIADEYLVRKAEISDLPQIHELVRDSYLILATLVDETMREAQVEAIESSLKFVVTGELSESEFEKNYFSSYGFYFWVAEERKTGMIGGCVGLRRHTSDIAELCRMAVASKLRGQSLGQRLVSALTEYSIETGVLQIYLTTGNPKAARFYEKVGFVDVAPPGSSASRMYRYLGERIIRKVSIIGGTHGNERLGVMLVNNWSMNNKPIKRSTFETTVLIGNPIATKLNSRYCDKDLNRQFMGKRPDFDDIRDDDKDSVEITRSAELNHILGPKGSINEPYGCDFIIDLHSTNSNIGILAMISGADHDYHALRIAHHLQSDGRFHDLRVSSSIGHKSSSYSVDSISPYGLAFEVGPVIHGTVSSELLERTRQLVEATLDCIEARNQQLISAAGGSQHVIRSQFRDIVQVYTPSSSSSSSSSSFSLDLPTSSSTDYPSSTNTLSSLICGKQPFTLIDCYIPAATVRYPDISDFNENNEDNEEDQEDDSDVEEEDIPPLASGGHSPLSRVPHPDRDTYSSFNTRHELTNLSVRFEYVLKHNIDNLCQ